MTRGLPGVLLALCLPPLAAAAGPSLPELPEHDVAVGEFVQRRHVPDVEITIESSGRFAYDADRGLLWEVREPVASRLVIDATGAYQDGRRVAAGGPLAAVRPIFGGLFGGDRAGLERRFAIDREPGGDGWQVILRPRQGSLAAAIDSIVIAGDTHPRRLVIAASDGSRTEILFRGVEHPPRLDQATLRAFDLARPGR